jgi:hypothetical protein
VCVREFSNCPLDFRVEAVAHVVDYEHSTMTQSFEACFAIVKGSFVAVVAINKDNVEFAAVGLKKFFR